MPEKGKGEAAGSHNQPPLVETPAHVQQTGSKSARQAANRRARKTERPAKDRSAKKKKQGPLRDGSAEIPLPEVRQKSGVLPTDLLAEAGRKTLLFHFAIMLSHEAGTRLGEDIEALHDMRVATRRMRAAFEVFSSAFEKKEIGPHLKGLRATGRALGAVRDLDVFIEKAGRYIEGLPEEHAADLASLTRAWSAQRLAARIHMLAHLDSPQYQEFKQQFNIFLSKERVESFEPLNESPQPVFIRAAAPVLLYERWASLMAFQPYLAHATVTQLHALRIEFKRFRYTLEFFKEVLGDTAAQLIAEVKRIQDHLGDLNDAVVACQLLNQNLGHWLADETRLAPGDRNDYEAVSAYLAYQQNEQQRLLVTFPDAWEHFDTRQTRLLLAEAVAAL